MMNAAPTKSELTARFQAAKLMKILRDDHSWRKDTYRIINGDASNQMISGWSNGLFGIAYSKVKRDRKRFYHTWVTTHLASGKRICDTDTLAEAKRRVTEVMDMTNWRAPNPVAHLPYELRMDIQQRIKQGGY